MKNVIVKCILATALFSSTHAVAGRDGGGGNIERSQLASLAQIQSSILDLRAAAAILAEPIFNNYYRSEFLWTLGADAPQRARRANKNVKIVGQMTRCPGQKSGEVAFTNRSANQICFSVVDIFNKRLTQFELDQKIFALYLHELAHLIGLNADKDSESTARQFQYDTEFELQLEGFSFANLDSKISKIRSQLTTNFYTTNQSLVGLCVKTGEKIGWVELRTNRIFPFNEDRTVAYEILTRRQIAKLIVISMWAQVAKMICDSSDFNWTQLNGLFDFNPALKRQSLLPASAMGAVFFNPERGNPGELVSEFGNADIFTVMVPVPKLADTKLLLSIHKKIEQWTKQLAEELNPQK